MFARLKQQVVQFGRNVGRAFVLLRKNNPLLISGATAFFTVFSLPPIIILLGTVLSKVIFKTEVISNKIYNTLETIFGSDTANTINQIAENFKSLASNAWITIGGILFLIFVSTTLFNVIQQAIHRMWRVRNIESGQFLNRLRHRGVALVIIILTGILMLVTAIAETLLELVKNYIADFIPDIIELVSKPAGIVIGLAVYTIWFTGLFRYLPSARMPIRIAFQGGLFTAVLFALGRFVLGEVLVTDRFGAIFGASASILLLMLFIFYSAMLIYLGAAFTFVLLKDSGLELPTRKHSERYRITTQSKEN
ncbi:MAG: YihY/virulence factor BrkB family protein [Cyclobacteriaceae bacterium]